MKLTMDKTSSKPRLLATRKGSLKSSILYEAIAGIVLLVVLFYVYAELLPTAQTAGDDLNASGVPLGSLFVGGGIVFIIIMAALVIVVVRNFMKSK